MTDSNVLYTLEEVSKHNGRNGASVWIVVRDVVLDVTDYMEQHPGGSDLIEEVGGQDATDAFESAGHSSDATKMLANFRIGELVQEDKRANRKTQNHKKCATDTNENRKRRSVLDLLRKFAC